MLRSHVEPPVKPTVTALVTLCTVNGTTLVSRLSYFTLQPTCDTTPLSLASKQDYPFLDL